MGFSEKAPDFQNACLFRRHRNKKLRVADLLHASTEAFSWTRFLRIAFRTDQVRTLLFVKASIDVCCYYGTVPHPRGAEQGLAGVCERRDPESSVRHVAEGTISFICIVVPACHSKFSTTNFADKFVEYTFACLLACLLARLIVCLLACLLACFLSCRPVRMTGCMVPCLLLVCLCCLFVCLNVYLFAYSPACSTAYLHACLIVRYPVCLLACLPACLRVYLQFLCCSHTTLIARS